VVSPEMDANASPDDVKYYVQRVEKVYQLYGMKDNIQLFTPADYNRFSVLMQDRVTRWLKESR